MRRNNKGITLVVLITTIVIMLILATVTIGTINGGLFDYAGKATGKAELSSILDRLEKVKIIQDNNNLNGTLSQVLGNEYSKYDTTFKIANGKLVYMGEDPKTVAYLFELGIEETAIENASAACAVLGHDFKEANYLDPKTCKRCGLTEGQKLVATAPHPDQSSENTAIGIGTDGQLVNLDNWTYEKVSGTWRLNGYTGSYSEQGEIEGTVPQVISNINVTSMASTFKNNTSIKIAPEIPPTVKIMTSTFEGCTALTSAPLLPYGVTNANSIFRGCSRLVTLPDGFCFPDSITGRNTMSTFYQCTNLKELPDSFKISKNSTTMYYMFYQCSSLERLPEGFTIPNTVSEIQHAFDGCSKLSELPDSFRLPPGGSIAYLFYNSGLTKLPDGFTVPEGYSSMEAMFSGCSKLEYLPDGFTLPSTLTSIYLGFQNCSKLVLPDNFTIPAGVKNTSYAFSNDYKIEGTITMLCDPTTNNYRMFYGTGNSGSGVTVYYKDTCTSISSIQSSSSSKVTFVELPTATE